MKPAWKTGLIVVSCCIMALVAAAALSAETPAPAGPGGNSINPQNNPGPDIQNDVTHQPLAEAITACTGKSAGDTCQFTDRDSQSAGTCDDKPGVLACAPGREHYGGQQPGGKTVPVSSVTMTATPRLSSVPPVASTTGRSTGTFSLTSTAGPDGGTLPAEYSCSGAGATPALSWSGAPSGTKEFALMVTTIPVDGSTRWNWVLYGIPAAATGLDRNSTGVGITGTGSHGTVMQYDPPCPQGPGAKTYTFTLYALSASPSLPASADQVTGEVLTKAISSITLDTASFDLSYSSS
jgi:phosphatidylethanolamine-binding protein (PEBP) family uncharacterized protein